MALITGNDRNNTLNGTANADTILGDRGNDTLNGLGGDDTLLGQQGKDTLNGGAGTNILVPGPGQDTTTVTGTAGTVVFQELVDLSVGNTRDTIAGFVPALDSIDIEGIDANLNVASDQDFVFGGVDSNPEGGEVSFYTQGGNTFAALDPVGFAAGAGNNGDFEVTLLGIHTLTAADFLQT